jgi:hypothetical protein
MFVIWKCAFDRGFDAPYYITIPCWPRFIRVLHSFRRTLSKHVAQPCERGLGTLMPLPSARSIHVSMR